jgi:hypothetical protein
MRRWAKIAVIVIGLAIVWPLAQIGLIIAQAQYIASGRPYCVEVSSDRFLHYKPVSSLLELNGFSLHAPFVNSGGSGSHSSMQWTFHALLVVESENALEWRNWSYWHQHFDSLAPQQLKALQIYSPDCQGKENFLGKLPLLTDGNRSGASNRLFR